MGIIASLGLGSGGTTLRLVVGADVERVSAPRVAAVLLEPPPGRSRVLSLAGTNVVLLIPLRSPTSAADDGV